MSDTHLQPRIVPKLCGCLQLPLITEGRKMATCAAWVMANVRLSPGAKPRHIQIRQKLLIMKCQNSTAQFEH